MNSSSAELLQKRSRTSDIERYYGNSVDYKTSEPNLHKLTSFSKESLRKLSRDFEQKATLDFERLNTILETRKKKEKDVL